MPSHDFDAMQLGDRIVHVCRGCEMTVRVPFLGECYPATVYEEIRAERERAHAKHGDASMESWHPQALIRMTILMEEVGEVAREFNEHAIRHQPLNYAALRTELIQVAAMAAAWADNIAHPAPEWAKDVTL